MSAGVIAASFAPVSTPIYAATVLADSPLAYYRMGDTSGVVLTDSSGNGRNGDIGTGTHAPVLNAASLLINDPANPSIDFTGLTSANGDYCSVPFGSWMNISSGITLEWWANPDDLTTRGHSPFDRDNTTSNQRCWQAVQQTNGRINFLFFNPSGTVRGPYISSTAVTVGVTYYHAITYDGSNVRHYHNGVADGFSGITDTIRISGVTTPLQIGRNANTSTGENYFDGRLDEMAVYGTALSAARILAHYTAGITP